MAEIQSYQIINDKLYDALRIVIDGYNEIIAKLVKTEEDLEYITEQLESMNKKVAALCQVKGEYHV